jgi:hypothetical protein
MKRTFHIDVVEAGIASLVEVGTFVGKEIGHEETILLVVVSGLTEAYVSS